MSRNKRVIAKRHLLFERTGTTSKQRLRSIKVKRVISESFIPFKISSAIVKSEVHVE